MPPDTEIIHGDARATGLESKSVHAIATSPPYWGLRRYLKPDDPLREKEIGAEPTPELYVRAMVEVGREMHRVLRDDGIWWLNIGDTYTGGGGGTPGKTAALSLTRSGEQTLKRGGDGGRPAGNLIGVPWLVAFALQTDGWILRSALPWIKSNGMPESHGRRLVTGHETIFMLTKSLNYFFDAAAVRVANPSAVAKHRELRTADLFKASVEFAEASLRAFRENGGMLLADDLPVAVTTSLAPYEGAHFACWPPALVAPLLRSSTSAGGCCEACGVQRTRDDVGGWKDACACGAPTIPARVFDPFGGSGTTAQVSRALGRRSVVCELNANYLPLIENRVRRPLDPGTMRPISMASLGLKDKMF